MAIKVRHDGNAAATAAAGVGSGRAKRRVETAKLAQNQPQHVQTISPAHASAPGASAPGIMSAGHATAPSAGGGSAPLTHAPTGASAASAPLTHAPTPTGGAGSRSSASRGSGAGGDLGEVKVTGTSIFERPDKESQWNPSTMRWERPWLPGEKEAEAAQRMNPVLADRAETQQALADQSMEGKMRLQGELADQAALRDMELYDYKLTQKQRMEIAAINDAVEEARKSGDWLPNELANLRRQADMLRMGIKPQAVPRGISPQRTVDENMVNIDGRRYFYTPNGDLKELDPRPSFKDFVSAFQSMRNVNTTRPGPGGVGTESVKETLSPEDTAAVVKSAADMYQKMFGVNPSAGQATQPSPASVPAPQPAPQAPAAQPAPQESDEDFLKRLRGE